MGLHSGVSWCDASWGPWEGCTKVSEGCRNCYAERLFKRFHKDFNTVRRTSDKTFYAPLRWKGSLKIMVCPQGDFFHPGADKSWRFEAFRIMSDCPQHTFIVPTKRTNLMADMMYYNGYFIRHSPVSNHLKNVWFLASVENQETADRRIPELLKLRKYGDWPVLGVSYEPALGKVDFSEWLPCKDGDPLKCKQNKVCCQCSERRTSNKPLDWLIMGGESGPGARPLHPDWARDTRDACKAAGVPYFFKQWGEWCNPEQLSEDTYRKYEEWPHYTGVSATIKYTEKWRDCELPRELWRVGTKAAGNLIDGEKWEQLPAPVQVPHTRTPRAIPCASPRPEVAK